jgi:hypothetical protein
MWTIAMSTRERARLPETTENELWSLYHLNSSSRCIPLHCTSNMRWHCTQTRNGKFRFVFSLEWNYKQYQDLFLFSSTENKDIQGIGTDSEYKAEWILTLSLEKTSFQFWTRHSTDTAYSECPSRLKSDFFFLLVCSASPSSKAPIKTYPNARSGETAKIICDSSKNQVEKTHGWECWTGKFANSQSHLHR